jgi:hypothetical protein
MEACAARRDRISALRRTQRHGLAGTDPPARLDGAGSVPQARRRGPAGRAGCRATPAPPPYRFFPGPFCRFCSRAFLPRRRESRNQAIAPGVECQTFNKEAATKTASSSVPRP